MKSKKHKKVCTTLNYIEHLIVLYSVVSISAFASLVGIPIWIMSSAKGLNTCAITAGIKKYKSIIRKQRRKNNKIVLLAPSMVFKLNTIEHLISRALIGSY